MSVPFSTTHLRVPPGLTIILEGLTREILRDQPEDIPTYALQYFNSLRKQRDESGMNPAEWVAKLEDSLSNNVLKANPDISSTTEMPVTKGNSPAPRTESHHSAEVRDVSSTRPNVPTASEEEEEEKCDISREEISPPLLDEVSRSKREPHPNPGTVSAFGSITAADGDDVTLQEVPVLGTAGGMTDADARAPELGAAEEDAGGQDSDDDEEEDSGSEEPEVVLTYPGPADVDVCATELGGTEESRQDEAAEEEEEAAAASPAQTHDDDDDASARVEKSLDISDTKPKEDSLTEEKDGAPQQTYDDDDDDDDDVSAQVEKSLDISGANTKVESLAEVEAAAASPELTHDDDDDDDDEDDEASAQVERRLDIASAKPEEDSLAEEEPTAASPEKTHDEDEDDEDDDDDDEDGGASGQVVRGSTPAEPKEESLTEISFEEVPEAHQKQSSEETAETLGEAVAMVTDKNTSHAQQLQEPDGTEVEVEASDDVEESLDISGVKPKEDSLTEISFEEIPSEEATEAVAVATDQNISDAGEHQGARGIRDDGPEVEVEGRGVTTELLKEEEEASDEEKEEEEEEGESEGGGVSTSQSADQAAADPQGGQRSSRSGRNSEEPEGATVEEQEECSRPQEEEDIMDIPLDDPEANRAAAKIQAGFRGHMTRKKMKPEDKAEGEEVSSTGEVLNGSQGDAETGGSGAVEGDDTSVPEQ